MSVLNGFSQTIWGIERPASPEEATQLLMMIAAGTHPTFQYDRPLAREVVAELINDYGANPNAQDVMGNNMAMLSLNSAKGKPEPYAFYQCDWMQKNKNGEYPALAALKAKPNAGTVARLQESTNMLAPKLYNDLIATLPPDRAELMRSAMERYESVWDVQLQDTRPLDKELVQAAVSLKKIIKDHERHSSAPRVSGQEMMDRLSATGLDMLNPPEQWRGRETELLDIVADMPRAWRWQMKDHPSLQGRWMDIPDVMPMTGGYPQKAEDFLTPEGEPKLNLLLWSKFHYINANHIDWIGGTKTKLRVFSAVPEPRLGDHFREDHLPQIRRDEPTDRPGTALEHYVVNEQSATPRGKQ